METGRRPRGTLEQEVVAALAAAARPMTPADVRDQLGADLAYTTVMTVLDRLAKKGVVTQERADRAYRYVPAQTREEMTAAVMLDALSATPDGAARDAALAHFVGRLGPAALEAAIEAARKGQ